MQYLLRLTDAGTQEMIVLSLPEQAARQAAIDVVFDIIGHEKPEELVKMGIVSAGQLEDFLSVQETIFDRDKDGIFIRDGISFQVNKRELNPDGELISAFSEAERDGMKYMRLDLTVTGGPKKAVAEGSRQATEPAAKTQEEMMQEFARIMLLHQIAMGYAIDVTKEYPELIEFIKFAESKEWIEVDVTKVAYKPTPAGKEVHDKFIAEAQDLIRRFDIFADVDLDSNGKARFDTGLGKDLRVPVLELSGIDPFRARFLLGINDGEWDNLSNWFELIENPDWYGGIFEVIERAPSVDSIGKEKLLSIIEQGKAFLRQEQLH